MAQDYMKSKQKAYKIFKYEANYVTLPT